MASKFRDDDSAYLAWLESYPEGYVLNTEPSPNPKYLILHKASCGQLHRKDPRQQGKTHAYMKVCAMEVVDLQQWVERHVAESANLAHCGICRP